MNQLFKRVKRHGQSKQAIMLLLALSILMVVLLFIFSAADAKSPRPMPAKPQQQSLAVSVVMVSPAEYTAQVVGYGEANPHYALDFTAQVSGQVEHLNKRFESGEHVKKGELLMQLENSAYVAAVANAESSVANAKLALLEEKRQVAQAKAEWQASGLKGEPISALVLRQPQLAVAKATLKQAEAALRNARIELNRTKLRTPFDALVVTRDVSLGAYVQKGETVASLYSTERAEVKIDLSLKDWQNLPTTDLNGMADLPVKLLSVEGQQQWLGHVLRVEQHLDGTTRQRALIVAVEQPLNQTPKLYPGTFLKAEVEGRTVNQLWKLPSSALSQRGEIWYVTEESTLANFNATPVFSDSEAIYIRVPETLMGEAHLVLSHPLSSYLQGMKVTVNQQKDIKQKDIKKVVARLGVNHA